MTHATEAVAGIEGFGFRLKIRGAVQTAMRIFSDSMHIVDDLKVCLVRNRTKIPFITADDPAILANRWQQQTERTRGLSFGLHSAGAIFILPLSPNVLCVGYDGDVYSIPHVNGWVETKHETDVHTLNEHQFLNCRANIFVREESHSVIVHDQFARSEANRPSSRYLINYAVLDHRDGEYSRYVVVDAKEAREHERAIIHTQVIHPIPSAWSRLIAWRPNGFAFTNGTGVGYVRRGGTYREDTQPFRREGAQK